MVEGVEVFAVGEGVGEVVVVVIVSLETNDIVVVVFIHIAVFVKTFGFSLAGFELGHLSFGDGRVNAAEGHVEEAGVFHETVVDDSVNAGDELAVVFEGIGGHLFIVAHPSDAFQ